MTTPVAVEKVLLTEVSSLAAVLSTGEFLPLFFFPMRLRLAVAVVFEQGTGLAV